MSNHQASQALNIPTRPDGWENLCAAPVWTGDKNASFEARIAANPTEWFNYIKAVEHNYWSLMAHVNKIALELAERFQSIQQYTEAVDKDKKQLIEQNNRANDNCQFIHALALSQAQAQAAGHHQTTARTRSAKAPDPDKYSGVDRTKTRPFLYLAKAKVRANRDRYEGVTEVETQLNLIAYVYSRLEGSAALQSMALIEKNHFAHVEDFFS